MEEVFQISIKPYRNLANDIKIYKNDQYNKELQSVHTGDQRLGGKSELDYKAFVLGDLAVSE